MVLRPSTSVDVASDFRSWRAFDGDLSYAISARINRSCRGTPGGLRRAAADGTG